MKERDWYSPGEVSRFSQTIILWLLRHIEILRSGTWPSEHKETGYTGGKSGRRQRAPFITAMDVLAELESRIERTGLDGILMEMVYSADTVDRQVLIQHIANAMHLEYRTVDKRVHTALRYICGRNRRGRSYQEFKSHKRGGHRP